MSKIEVNTIDTIAGSTTLTLGSTNATLITLDSGAQFSNVSGQNYPAFEAYLSASQNVSDATHTKCEFDIERFDTDNCYDNTTNYRFTPTVAGKYFVYCQIELDSNADQQIAMAQARIYKNGSAYSIKILEATGNPIGQLVSLTVNSIIDMNVTTDYLEGFGYCDDTTSSPAFLGSSLNRSFFGAFRIGA